MGATALPVWHTQKGGVERQQSMSLGQRLWFGFSWVALGVFLAGLNRLKIVGAEHVPPGGGVLLVANHLSIVDTLLIPWVNMAKVRLGGRVGPGEGRTLRYSRY